MHSAKHWAILIGINRYHASLGPLKYCVNDCRRLADVLVRTGAVAPENLLVLADDEEMERQPRFGAIHQWLAAWLSQPEEGDTIILYFAGHGREMNGRSYLVPADASLQSLNVMGIPIAHVREQLCLCKARQKILVLDACHSGSGRDVSTMSGAMVAELSAANGIYTVTSCARDERSHEWEEKQQGVFSYYLVEALAGSCLPDSNGQITVDSLYSYVYERVREWSRRTGCAQTPTRFCEGAGTISLLAGVNPIAPPLPPHAAADLERATRLLAEGELADALVAVKAGLEKEKLSYELRRLEREIGEAIQHRDKEQELTRQRQVEERLAKLLDDSQKYERSGDLPTALACLEEAERLNPARASLVLESLRRRLDLGGLDRVAQLKFLFRQAEQAEAASPEAALAAYQEALNVYPGNKRATEGIAQCSERIRKNRLEEGVRAALGNVEEEARGLALTVARLETELKDYRELAMEQEAAQSEQELEAYLVRLGRSTDLHGFLQESVRILASAQTIASARAALEAAAKQVPVEQLPLDVAVRDELFPKFTVARAELLRWCDEVEAIINQSNLVWREYQSQFAAEQERVRSEQARLDLEHAARPIFLRAFLPSPKVAPRKITPPPQPEAVELPFLPKLALSEFGMRCRELVPEDKRAMLDAAQPPGWMPQRLQGAETPDRPALQMRPTLHLKEQRAAKAPVSDGPEDVSFDSWISTELNLKPATMKRLQKAMKEALLSLIRSRRRESVQVKIARFGIFEINRGMGIVCFKHQPALESTSQDFRVALRARPDVDREEIEKCIMFWVLLDQYCRTNGQGVRLGGVGRFAYAKDGSLQLRR